MTLSARVAYLKGLFDGLDYDKKDSKMMSGILELLEDMAQSVEELEEENAALNEVVDVLMETVFSGNNAGAQPVASAEETEEPDADSDEEVFEDSVEEDAVDEDVDMSDQTLYQVICPRCGEEIFVEEHDLEAGSIACPVCGEELEFDMAADDDDIVELPDGLIGEIPNIEG